MNKGYKLDIHSMAENDAYCALLGFLNDLPQGIKKAVIVHGYHGGTVLKEMVKNFVHWRIDYVMQPLYNQGESVIYFKE